MAHRNESATSMVEGMADMASASLQGILLQPALCIIRIALNQVQYLKIGDRAEIEFFDGPHTQETMRVREGGA